MRSETKARRCHGSIVVAVFLAAMGILAPEARAGAAPAMSHLMQGGNSGTSPIAAFDWKMAHRINAVPQAINNAPGIRDVMLTGCSSQAGDSPLVRYIWSFLDTTYAGVPTTYSSANCDFLWTTPEPGLGRSATAASRKDLQIALERVSSRQDTTLRTSRPQR